jgi:hypothetical protein
MSLKKTAAILAAAGALAAISVPAMALENEFHGLYNFNFTGSNFQDGGSGDYNPAGKAEKPKMNNFFDQRARIFYTAKASDDIKLVTGFELDARWGTGRTNTPNSGGTLDTDTITLETKWVYLDFNLGQNFNTKVGLQPYKDTIKGLFIDADLPAVMTTSKFGAYTLGVGFSRFAEETVTYDNGTATLTDNYTRLGDSNKDLFILDNTFAFTKDTKASLSYYFLADYAAGTTGGQAGTILDIANKNQDLLLNTFALSGETKAGPATLSGFLAGQAGHQKLTGFGNTSKQFHGWAANAAAKMAAGPGTAKAAFLFTSGNNSTSASHYNGWVTSSVNTYNEGGMMILARNTLQSPTTNDRYIRRNVTNLALLTLGYDANLTDKVFLNGNLGFGWAPASSGTATFSTPQVDTNPRNNAGDYLGTEINLESGYKVSPNLTLKATAAYMVLGAYYKHSGVESGTGRPESPENPYSMRLHAQFKF